MFAVPLGGLISGARFTAGTNSASPRSTSPSVTDGSIGALVHLVAPDDHDVPWVIRCGPLNPPGHMVGAHSGLVGMEPVGVDKRDHFVGRDVREGPA